MELNTISQKELRESFRASFKRLNANEDDPGTLVHIHGEVDYCSLDLEYKDKSTSDGMLLRLVWATVRYEPGFDVPWTVKDGSPVYCRQRYCFYPDAAFDLDCLDSEPEEDAKFIGI
mgnify:CR=1 FL=1|tara:strand:- start:997 stop:1347 length:351 start_codon:yes stop_codon:yes gene_type:complete